MRCYCCSNLPFSSCCEPFLKGQAKPQTAAQLMRSRFSAYASKQFEYVLATYTKERQPELSVDELTANAANATWFALEVGETGNVSLIAQAEGVAEVATQNNEGATDTVDFTAYYFENKNLYQLHETSNFIVEDGQWRYHDGILHDDCGKVKYGRNLPCLCGSGKKFKQCCATKSR
ncbi:YchJ family protein [Alteromonas stellipolaris]|uniref:YchJ family protein n=1 Tax=Alteromonas stellipolaris TaxID=233316 RepID=UPI003C6D04E2